MMDWISETPPESVMSFQHASLTQYRCITWGTAVNTKRQKYGSEYKMMYT